MRWNDLKMERYIESPRTLFKNTGFSAWNLPWSSDDMQYFDADFLDDQQKHPRLNLW